MAGLGSVFLFSGVGFSCTSAEGAKSLLRAFLRAPRRLQGASSPARPSPNLPRARSTSTADFDDKRLLRKKSDDECKITPPPPRAIGSSLVLH
jgi:hypothetical protein